MTKPYIYNFNINQNNYKKSTKRSLQRLLSYIAPHSKFDRIIILDI